MSVRPDRLVAVLGTGTEVGKTWTVCALLRALRAAGVTTAARKPAQSFEPGSGPTDAHLLAEASGDDRHRVCPPHRWYPVPMAPPMAADALERPPVDAQELLGELAWPGAVGVGFVETVGGVRSPLADDTDSAGFAALLRPDQLVLVAHAELGTINDVRLAVEALTDAVQLTPTVYLNRYDDTADLHRRNRRWLSDRDHLPVATRISELLPA